MAITLDQVEQHLRKMIDCGLGLRSVDSEVGCDDNMRIFNIVTTDEPPKTFEISIIDNDLQDEET